MCLSLSMLWFVYYWLPLIVSIITLCAERVLKIRYGNESFSWNDLASLVCCFLPTINIAMCYTFYLDLEEFLKEKEVLSFLAAKITGLFRSGLENDE